ncbi:rho GTPase activator [Purpureocillium lavendulum]|uniref:Rho GTPase activator n=1 Tax=Purpureocillium lavendulum TaxID=1247861 RepID=A0AB34G665_9HYPO|nr:rho GTPase activator [Purpureocillium lavendulum]
MGRKPTPQPLMLAESNALEHVASSGPASTEVAVQGLSPADSRSSSSHRSSPLTSRFAPKRPQTGKPPLQPLDGSSNHQHSHHQRSQSARDERAQVPATGSPASHAPAPQPATRPTASDSKKPTKSGFFHFAKSSKSSNQLLNLPATQPHIESRDQTLITEGDQASARRNGDSPYIQDSLQKTATSTLSRSEISLTSAAGEQEPASIPSPGKKSKSKSFGILSRTKSARENKGRVSPQPPATVLPATSAKTEPSDDSAPLRTAPVTQDRAFRDMMNSTTRNRSEDRAVGRETAHAKEYSREREHRHAPLSSSRDNSGGSTFLSGLRSSSTRAADMISKGLFGKSSRSGSTTEREPIIDDEHYVLKVINLPLIEQTRLTRISKRLENSRDKTEFWMPAFPWRAIDYLNYKGCDVEGLYRVPGSGPQIKKWQRKFDEQYDVNLFEEDELYDINIIGSMLKAWLRELPDELFPKESQERIARECAGSTEVPQLLIDELSNLSPFNYYLLFAITCHLSLLLAHSDKNKMDFRNLCICFQPCMKIDAFCFKFLVCDWRDCWKGCKSESKYIEQEYRLFDQPPPRGLSEPQRPSQSDEPDSRQLSSPESALHSTNGSAEVPMQPKGHRIQFSNSNASIHSSDSSISNGSPRNHHEPTQPRDLRPLSPIQPLSPIGF